VAKTKEDILELTKRRYDEFEGFRVQSLNDYELSTIESRWAEEYRKTEKFSADMRAELLTLCLVNDEGERLFGNDEIAVVREIDSKISKPLYAFCREHVGMDEKADIDNLGKGSDETDDSDSPQRFAGSLESPT
jgi:hypothetical protein